MGYDPEAEFQDHIRKMLEAVVGETRADSFFRYVKAANFEEVLNEYVSIAAGFAAAKLVMEMELESRKTHLYLMEL